MPVANNDSTVYLRFVFFFGFFCFFFNTHSRYDWHLLFGLSNKERVTETVTIGTTNNEDYMYLYIYVCVHIYIHIPTHTYTYMYVYIYYV